MKTKFGIVGCGFLGGIVANAWKNGLLADYELVGVTSRSPESAQKMAEIVGCPACADVDALLALEPEYIVETASVEAVRAMAAAQYENREKTKLMASVAAISTDEAIEYAKTAKALGYDAMISTVPYYYKFGMKAISAYYGALREAVDLPLFLYNFPGNTGVELDIADDHIRGMLTDGTIAGVKQTSLNLYQMERIRDLNPELVIYGGFDEVYIGARILGADGAIGSTFNFTLPLFNQIEAAYSALDIPKAQALQKRANNIMQALVSCSLFPSIKHILKTQGVDCGGCRKPFPTLTEAQKAYIERVVRENM